MVKKEQENRQEETSSLRERIRDQKYPKGFMQPDFSQISEAGRAHIKHLSKPIPIYGGESSTDRWLQMQDSPYVVQVMKPTPEAASHSNPKNSNKKIEQGS